MWELFIEDQGHYRKLSMLLIAIKSFVIEEIETYGAVD